MKSPIPLLAILVAAAALLAACAPLAAPTPTSTPTASLAPPTPTPSPTPTATPTPTSTPTPTPTPLPLTLSSGAFAPGGQIPERYGYFRHNASPPLSWEHVPQGTYSLVLMVEDLDQSFCHWVVYSIPADAGGLEEAVMPQPQLPDGTLQGTNDNDMLGYIGPYPPAGETHRYAFILYALDGPLGLGPGARREQVTAAMEGHVLARSELIGTYVGVSP